MGEGCVVMESGLGEGCVVMGVRGLGEGCMVMGLSHVRLQVCFGVNEGVAQ